METNETISKQEENWLLMTLLQIPWNEANKIDDPEDRKFLVGKANELRQELIRQRDAAETQSQLITPHL
jgi:hypothetical protein